MATSHDDAHGLQNLVLELADVQRALESQSQACLNLAGQLAAVGTKAEQLSPTTTMSSQTNTVEVDNFSKGATSEFLKEVALASKTCTTPATGNAEATEQTRCNDQECLTPSPWTLNFSPFTAASVSDPAENRRGLFHDPQQLQDIIRKSIQGTPYSVTQYYKETGLFQAIARSPVFEHLSMALVLCSSLWIAVDLDFNHAPVLHQSDIGFQVVSNTTCLLFLVELMIRFLAFQDKRYLLRDFWCMFDLLVAILVVVETWVLWFLIALLRINMSTLQNNMRALIVLRMMRLMRMLRLVKLFRFLPEVLVIVRSIFIAIRAISLVFVLLLLIIYMGAIAFRVLLENSAPGKAHFETVTQAMGTLLLDCALSGTKGALLMRETYQVSPVYSLLMFCFALISNVTVMGVLTALLVQTIKKVADVEEDQRRIIRNETLVDNFWNHVVAMDENGDGYIVYDEFVRLLHRPETLQLLQKLDVNPEILVFLSDFMFEENEGRLSQHAFNQWVLDLRSMEQSTLKDHYVTRKFMKAKLGQIFPDAPKANRPCNGTREL